MITRTGALPNSQEDRGLIPRIQSALKALVFGGDPMPWGRMSMWGDTHYSGPGASSYGTNIDYTTQAGDLAQNAIIMSVIQSIMRAFPEAPMKVMRAQGDGGSQVVPDHPLAVLLKKPNPWYSGRLLWQATIFSYNLNGNAFWLKVRNGQGRVIELWWEPHFTIRAVWPRSGEEFISYYEVLRGSEWLRVDRQDVVHFRFGLDPNNPRMGLSPLASALMEVFTDKEAARYSATVLRNMGVPGVVISPKPGEGIINPEQAKMLFMQKFNGDRRGEPLILTDAIDVSVLSFSPEQMSLEKLRRIPEERIPALLSWPAVVAGLGAGLDRSTYNNMDEARQQAYEQNIIPTQMVLSDDLGTQLMPDLGSPETESVVFDLSQVRVLQDDQFKLYQRLNLAYEGDWVKRSEVRTATGWPVTPEDEGYKSQLGGSVSASDNPPPGTVPDVEVELPEPTKALDPVHIKARKPSTANRRATIERRIEKEMAGLLQRHYEKAASAVERVAA